MQVWSCAHAAVAGVGDEVTLMNGQYTFGDGSIEGIALITRLKVANIFGNSAMIAIQVEIDGGDATRVVDI